MNNKKFTLSTEAINEKGGFKFVIKTEGILIPENKVVPIFYEHNNEILLGKWADFEKVESKLIAQAVWDTEDSTITHILNKIAKGFVDRISIYVKVLEYYIDENDVRVITKSLLKEGSVTTLPINEEATIEDMNIKLSYQVNFKEGEEVALSTFNNAVEKQIAEKVKEDEVAEVVETPDTVEELSAVEEVKTEEVAQEPVEDKIEAVEEVKEVVEKDEVVKEPKKRKRNKEVVVVEDKVEDKGLKLSDEVMDIIKDKELKLNDNITAGDFELILNSMAEDIKHKDSLIQETELKLSEVREELSELKLNDKRKGINEFLNAAVKEGKIKSNQVEGYYKLSEVNDDAFENVKGLINNMSKNIPNNIKLSDKIEVEKADANKDFEWYQKNASAELLEMRKTSPDEYSLLYQAHVNKLNKK